MLKGHEFHYSRVINPEAASEFNAGNIYFAFGMKRGEGITDKLDGLCYKNVLATYTHTHALGTPEWTSGMIKKQQNTKRTAVNPVFSISYKVPLQHIPLRICTTGCTTQSHCI